MEIMNNKKLKKEEEASKKDRISELPDSILLHILSYLPAKDALLKASFLSKRWTPLRPFLPSLVFVQPTRPPTSSGVDFDRNWASFVDSTLIRIDFRHLTRFCVAFRYISTKDGNNATRSHGRDELDHRSQVDTWVSFAIQRNSVKILELLLAPKDYHFPGVQYILPWFLFKYEGLTALSLKLCRFKDCGDNIINWKFLKNLSMESTTFSDPTIFDKLIAGCPVLETLRLVCCDGIQNLDISSKTLKVLVVDHCKFEGDIPGEKFRVLAPNLRVFVISGLMLYNQFVVEDYLPCLVEATLKEEELIKQPRNKYHACGNMSAAIRLYNTYEGIHDSTNDVNIRKSMVREFLNSAQHATKLTMGTWCLQVFFIESLPCSFLRCTSLTLDINLKQYELPGLAMLLRNCPNLESLTISFWKMKSVKLHHEEEVAESDTTGFVEGGQHYNTACLQHLKVVNILDLNPLAKGGTLVILLLEFLLKHGRMLEKLLIHTKLLGEFEKEDGSTINKLETKDNLFDLSLFKMVSSLPRSSPNVVIQVD